MPYLQPQPQAQPHSQVQLQQPAYNTGFGSHSQNSVFSQAPHSQYVPQVIPQQQPFISQSIPYQPFVELPQAQHQPIGYAQLQTPLLPQQSYPKPPSGCCGGNWFSSQGGLCSPVNYNPCQQQSPCCNNFFF